MTKVIGKGQVIIEPEEDRKCERCGKLEELRPYGPGGISICFRCAMEDEEGTRKRMFKHWGYDED